MLSFDASSSESTTDEAVAEAVDLFLKDFLQREYPEDYKGTDVETVVTETGEGEINVETSGDAVFNGSPTAEEMKQDLGEYLANGGDSVLADFLANAGVTNISNISLDGEPVEKETEEAPISSGSNPGAIAGGVVGGIALCSLVGCCIAWFRKRPDDDDEDDKGNGEDDDDGDEPEETKEKEQEEQQEDEVAVEGEHE